MPRLLTVTSVPVTIGRIIRFLRVPGLLALVMVGAVACRGASGLSTQPSPPSATTANVSGTWSGTASDSSGPGQMTWQLTQTDTSFTGAATVTDTNTGVSGTGSVSGTVTGSAVQFLITIPAGGFPSPFTTCSANVSGSGQATSSTITGTYVGTSSCVGTLGAGQFTLNKQ